MPFSKRFEYHKSSKIWPCTDLHMKPLNKTFIEGAKFMYHKKRGDKYVNPPNDFAKRINSRTTKYYCDGLGPLLFRWSISVHNKQHQRVWNLWELTGKNVVWVRECDDGVSHSLLHF